MAWAGFGVCDAVAPLAEDLREFGCVGLWCVWLWCVEVSVCV